ncbi:MAG: TIGR02757 family protein [Arcticibacter sp.]
MQLTEEELILVREFLDSEHDRFNRADFIENDPISIPHRYTQKEDREISGFLTATISWGQRQGILKNAVRLMELMDDHPHAFLKDSSKSDWKRFSHFVHRTFNGTDCMLFIDRLSFIYRQKGGLHQIFSSVFRAADSDMGLAISKFRSEFFGDKIPGRTGKHFSDPARNSAAKRLCMYLRWMVRRDSRGVDFGLWSNIPASALMCPLDVHSGRVARGLGILQRLQNDWKSVEELSQNLRVFDINDPCKYDFALFGGGVSERHA